MHSNTHRKIRRRTLLWCWGRGQDFLNVSYLEKGIRKGEENTEGSLLNQNYWFLVQQRISEMRIVVRTQRREEICNVHTHTGRLLKPEHAHDLQCRVNTAPGHGVLRAGIAQRTQSCLAGSSCVPQHFCSHHRKDAQHTTCQPVIIFCSCHYME